MSGKILLISGPSGVGKSSIINFLKQKIINYYFSISTTTRKPRINEKNGIDYYFISEEEFKFGIKNNHFLEYATVHNNYYGTSLEKIEENLNQNKLIILDIDVQGYFLIKDKFNSSLSSIFIFPPSIEKLKQRLIDRSMDSINTIEKRIKIAEYEMKFKNEYHYNIINDDLNSSFNSVLNIIKKEFINYIK